MNTDKIKDKITDIANVAKIDKVFKSKISKRIIIFLIILIALLVVFKIGLIVGAKKADFSCRWSDNYNRNFGGPRKGFLNGFGDRDFIESNGVFGQIIKIDGQNLIIKGRNDTEKIILVKNDTTIKNTSGTINLDGLKTDDYIIAIGDPNNEGKIEAKLIRIFNEKKWKTLKFSL